MSEPIYVIALKPQMGLVPKSHLTAQALAIHIQDQRRLKTQAALVLHQQGWDDPSRPEGFPGLQSTQKVGPGKDVPRTWQDL